jgi:hypothetical protein
VLTLLLAQAAFRHAATSEFAPRTVAGFTVMVSPAAQADPERLRPVLALLDEKLTEIGRLVPSSAYRQLRKVRFWIEHDNPETPGMTFHPGADWLREHGYNVDKAGGVEVGNLEHFLSWRSIQPYMELHELAHAWEFRFMDRRNLRLLERTFAHAKQSGKYNWVLYANGKRRRAYALSNQHEYFAELTEAYFGKNDFFPFNREQLKAHDPEGYELVEGALGR